jgi:hypothetical protein
VLSCRPQPPVQIASNTTDGQKAVSHFKSPRRATLIQKVPYYTTLYHAVGHGSRRGSDWHAEFWKFGSQAAAGVFVSILKKDQTT